MFASSCFIQGAGAVAGVATLLGFGLFAPAQATVTDIPLDSPVGSLQPAGDVPPSFGDPLTTQLCGVSGDGISGAGYLECQQKFQKGAIFWNELTGAHLVQGAIYQAWSEESAKTARGVTSVSELQPTTNEVPVANGVEQHFSFADQGRVVYFWSSESGAHFVDVDTSAGQFFINGGGAEAFGFPVGEVAVNPDGTSTLQTTTGMVTAHFDASGQFAGAFIAS